MQRRSKIIIGYEPEHQGDAALAAGYALAVALGASPVVATVLPWPRYLPTPEPMDQHLTDRLTKQFSAEQPELSPRDPVSRVFTAPSAASGLEEMALAEHAHLVVVGTSQHRPVDGTLAGRVGESLLHGSSQAVAVAPRDYEGPGEHGFKRIAVAFDGSSESWSALETAIALVEAGRGSLTVATVAEVPAFTYVTPWSGMAAAPAREVEREHCKRLLELAHSRIPDGLAGDTRLLEGDPGEALARISGDYDLMLVGSRGWGPLRRTLLGSATRTLTDRSSCPVLVLPRGAGLDPLGLHPRHVAQPAAA